MSIDLLKDRGLPLERQVFDWPDLVRPVSSKLDDDAFTRVRIILMNGIEAEAVRFQHAAHRLGDAQLRPHLARVRRIDHHQQTLVNWLLPPDLSPLETTIAYEQVAVEVTASLAQNEPDPYLAQTYRFGLLEDFDHLFRYSALLDRLEGKDPNTILQSYTDICPGRPTVDEHRAPLDDLRDPYDRATAAPLSKLNVMTIVAAEHQTRDYYMNIGPQFADPVARQLYAEIASIEEQHVTQYGSLIDPAQTVLEQWLLHEATEVYNYHSCVEQEGNPRIKAIWERFLDYELGQLAYVSELFKQHERRDPAEVLPRTLPDPISFSSHRAFVRRVLADEVDLRAVGTRYVHRDQLPSDSPSLAYNRQMNGSGSPSQAVAAGYVWSPGGEPAARVHANTPAGKEPT